MWGQTHLNVGWFDDVDSTLDLDACERLGVAVIRRPVYGGGTAFYDAGCAVMWGFLLPKDRYGDLDQALARFQPVLLDTLAKIGLGEVQFEGSSDLRWHGRKLGALTAQDVVACNSVGGFLNIAPPNLDLYLQVVRVPEEKFKDKVVKDMREYVCTAEEVAGREVTYEEFRDALLASLEAAGIELEASELNDGERHGLDKIGTRVGSDEMVRRVSSERFTRAAPAGSVVGFGNHKGRKLCRAGVALDAGGVIVAALMAGDMHVSPPDTMDRVAAVLVGAPSADAGELRRRIASVFEGDDIHQADAAMGVTTDDLLAAVQQALTRGTKGDAVKALVFGAFPDPMPPQPPDDAPRLIKHLASTPMALQDIDDPKLIGPDWAIIKPRMTGICGSDTKQVLMDYEHGEDSPMTAFISFPQVLGHEVVATVEEMGPDVEGFEPGQRVVLNPWLSCAPRGITPLCPPCEAGDWSLCWNFFDGRLARGIHTGNSSDATGGFAELVPAHQQMMIPVPDGVTDEVAVLGDPFAVTSARHHPQPTASRRQGSGLRRRRARHVRDGGVTRPVSRRRGGDDRGMGRASRARREARRDGLPARTARGAHRAARGLVGGRAAQAVGRAPDLLPGLRRRGVRHHRRAGDVRSRHAGAQVARDDGAARSVHVDARRVLTAVLQGDPVGRLERVRDRGGRRRPQARDRALPRHGSVGPRSI